MPTNSRQNSDDAPRPRRHSGRNPDAHPVFRKKRPVPYAYVAALDEEIDRLLAEQVLSPVAYSAWAAPIVVVKKTNATLRLCADFSTGLNDALMLHQHPLPTPDDVFAKLNGGTAFTQIDLADAYLQIEVGDEAKELLTINTHRGLPDPAKIEVIRKMPHPTVVGRCDRWDAQLLWTLHQRSATTACTVGRIAEEECPVQMVC
ncbi:hypothetical protein V3C99_000852 [Haemonchus contortus]|uniref:Uncharacterized protein K02A2.6-like n=1 Tax=Haemonchus contortus TaxID=6289 RepID=W6NA14_HAECO